MHKIHTRFGGKKGSQDERSCVGGEVIIMTDNETVGGVVPENTNEGQENAGEK